MSNQEVNGFAPQSILVVDDDESIVRLVANILEAHGYEVITATGAQRAIEVLDVDEAPVDLLLSDVQMPGMTGVERAECFRKLRPGVPVLFMTGYPGSLAKDQPALLKPFGRNYLEAAFQHLLKPPD
jgi:two-component system, cell cycle sensor histidine kinase and response regulator CckA